MHSYECVLYIACIDILYALISCVDIYTSYALIHLLYALICVYIIMCVYHCSIVLIDVSVNSYIYVHTFTHNALPAGGPIF